MKQMTAPLLARRRARAVLAAGVCAGATLASSAGAQAHDCVVTDWALARAIAAGAPVGRGRRFSGADGKVYAFVKLNCTRVEGPVTFRFARDGRRHAAVELPVRASAGWRTWASVRALAGNWRVTLEIEGRRLLDDEFVVGR
jgi:hypothetical protein